MRNLFPLIIGLAASLAHARSSYSDCVQEKDVSVCTILEASWNNTATNGNNVDILLMTKVRSSIPGETLWMIPEPDPFELDYDFETIKSELKQIAPAANYFNLKTETSDGLGSVHSVLSAINISMAQRKTSMKPTILYCPSTFKNVRDTDLSYIKCAMERAMESGVSLVITDPVEGGLGLGLSTRIENDLFGYLEPHIYYPDLPLSNPTVAALAKVYSDNPKKPFSPSEAFTRLLQLSEIQEIYDPSLRKPITKTVLRNDGILRNRQRFRVGQSVCSSEWTMEFMLGNASRELVNMDEPGKWVTTRTSITSTDTAF